MILLDCPNPTEALSYWYKYNLNFETKHWPNHPLNQQQQQQLGMDNDWSVQRQTNLHPENFAYMHNKVLFIGINLVGGVIHNQTEWDERLEANLEAPCAGKYSRKMISW